MVSYIGRHAALYDIFYAGKPYIQEAEFVQACLEKYDTTPVHRILELACGTGTHAILFGQAGFDVTAIDSSADMLARAAEKALGVNSNVRFNVGDMRTLDRLDGPYDAVLCLFDSIGYVQTNEAILGVLEGVREHLRSSGLFIFEFWHAPAMLRYYEPVRVREFADGGNRITRISETRLDCVRQLGEVTYTIYEHCEGGTYSELRETQTNRYFQVQEMSGFLDRAGLEPVKWFAGFKDDERIGLDTWHVVAVARRVAA